MISLNFARLHLLAQLSMLVYETDMPTLARDVHALGLDFAGLLGNDECQAMICHDGATQIVAIRGTQVEQNLSLIELWDDVDPGHTDIGGGALVRSGAWGGLAALWRTDLAAAIDAARPLIVTGHSLGGQRALLLPALLPEAMTTVDVVAFGPPKPGNRAFWMRTYGSRPAPVVVAREDDFAPAWCPFDLVAIHPGPILHLCCGGWDWVPDWDAEACSVADHDVGRYVADLDALARGPR